MLCARVCVCVCVCVCVMRGKFSFASSDLCDNCPRLQANLYPFISQQGFSFDTTGSMFRYLEEVKNELKGTITALFKELTNLRVRFFHFVDVADCC